MRNIVLAALLLLSLQAHSQQTHEDEFHAWIKTQSPMNLAKFTADITAKSLPIQMDSLTLLYSVFAVQNEITMRVQVLVTKDKFIKILEDNGKTLVSYIPEFKTMVTNMGCTQKTNMAYIAQGVDYRYLVSDNQHNKLFEVSVKDCP